VANKDDIALMAHLMRRAGFSASREELEARVEKGYEATVEELLYPEKQESVNSFDLLRYHPWAWKPASQPSPGGGDFMYRMINTKAPLQEKMTLFWHGLFATGLNKIDHWHEVDNMLKMLRERGLENYRDMLQEVAKNPGMIFWLDNNENHSYAVNENWGRELLELFSMGVGNYTEKDVREASRAFTGWGISPAIPRYPYGRHDWIFEYHPEDHDNDEKTFLGHVGNFNGNDVIDIICEQPATARFICRHLYSFFVADEPQVPAWSVTPPVDPQAIETLAKVFRGSRCEIRPVMRTLLNSDFFKEATFTRIKSPTEVVVDTIKMVGGAEFPVPGFSELVRQPGYMGQDLLNPPSVEGWHAGKEWINSGTLMKRVNYCADMVGDITRPGVKNIISRIKEKGDVTAEQLLDSCLDLMGPLEIDSQSRQELVDNISKAGDLCWETEEDEKVSAVRVTEAMQLIVALREFQYV